MMDASRATSNLSPARRRAFCLALLALFFPTHARAESTPGGNLTRVQVTVQTEEERHNLKGTHTDRLTVHKTLQIRFSGKPRQPESRVVQWKIHGKNLATGKLEAIGHGEFPLKLTPDGIQTAASAKVTSIHTPDHILSHGKDRAGGKIAASGIKYAGYAIQVMDGTTVVGTASDPPGIENRR
jgi:hypothetical protein